MAVVIVSVLYDLDTHCWLTACITYCLLLVENFFDLVFWRVLYDQILCCLEFRLVFNFFIPFLFLFLFLTRIE